jgi:hypothetical protein
MNGQRFETGNPKPIFRDWIATQTVSKRTTFIKDNPGVSILSGYFQYLSNIFLVIRKYSLDIRITCNDYRVDQVICLFVANYRLEHALSGSVNCQQLSTSFLNDMLDL